MIALCFFFGPSALAVLLWCGMIATDQSRLYLDTGATKCTLPAWPRRDTRGDRDTMNMTTLTLTVTTSHWTWQRNIALTTLNFNRQNLKVSSALLCTLLLQFQHAWSLGWFLPFEAQKSWDFLWSSMITKPGSLEAHAFFPFNFSPQHLMLM